MLPDPGFLCARTLVQLLHALLQRADRRRVLVVARRHGSGGFARQALSKASACGTRVGFDAQWIQAWGSHTSALLFSQVRLLSE